MQLESMTGFGEGRYRNKLVMCVAEVRSYNSRTLDIIIRGDTIPARLEAKIRSVVKSTLIRGRVEITFLWRYEPQGLDRIGRVMKSTIDQIKGKSFPAMTEDALYRLVDANALNAAAFEELRSARISSALHAIRDALSEVQNSRKKEGRLLTKEMRGIFSRLTTHFNHIQQNVISTSASVGERKNDAKQDVSEELARITVHLSTLQSCLKAKGHQGKKMEFVLQELLREFTTTGSKIGKSHLSKSITLGKLEIERLREQAQNIV